MSGKAYTMKEMKAIVDYITEHKSYSEIKGRKMWMECASSKITNRSWQSLKETFLKRILPDIHNPYYKLSSHQITNFRQGYDLETKLKNKLEIQPVTENSKSNADNNKDIEHPTTSNGNTEEKVTGEDPKVVSHHRDSTDTLVLDNCYETADDIQRDLSSPNTEDQGKQVTSSAKSLRDMIEYEPMTPMLQKLIDDFATDDDDGSDKEPRMQIDEDADKTNENNKDTLIEISDTEEPLADNNNEAHVEETVIEAKLEKADPKNVTLHLNTENEVSSSDNNVQKGKAIIPKPNGDINSVDTAKNINGSNTADIITQNNSNMTTDTLLPNNQEELDTELSRKQNSKSSNNSQKLSMKKKSNKKYNTREIKTPNNKKKAVESEKEKFTSDTLQGNEIEDNQSSKKKSNNSTPAKDTDNSKQNSFSKINQSVKKTMEKPKQTHKSDNEKSVGKSPSSLENPCLKSVSLYDEQFSNTKYSDSESSNNNVPKNSQKVPETSEKQKDDLDDCVLLKSHSESESDNETTKKTSRVMNSKRQRDKSIANIFGYTSGAVSGRKRRLSRRESISRHKTLDVSSGSSEWTSDGGCEFVPPPRGRKNRITRKYLKPKSARILSMGEEGGLFVMYGKKIFPIVKDGKIVKNYVTYSPDNASDEEESRWKTRYLEEKKRTAELRKMLNDVEKKKISMEDSTVSNMPSVSNAEVSKTKDEEIKVAPDKHQALQENVMKEPQEEKTLKIKFSDHDKEVQLEGHWSHINPVLEQVIQLLNKQSDLQTNDAKSKPDGEVSRATSRVPTPVYEIDDVKEKVDRMERAIFQEIEEDEIMEVHTPVKKQSDEYVTKRNVNKCPGSPASPAGPSAAKRARHTRASDKVNNIIKPARKTRNSLLKKYEETITADFLKDVKPKGDTDKRYKVASLPSDSKINRNTKNQKTTPQRKSLTRYMTRSRTRTSGISLENVHDSDTRPLGQFKDEKRKLSFSSTCSDIKVYNPDINNLNITEDLSNESSNSYENPLSHSITFHNSTLSTELYRSESYQMLMPSSKNISRNLEKIEEVSLFEELYKSHTHLSNSCKDIDYMNIQEHNDYDGNSNTSLPTSPVLSIVENLTINKTLLSNADDFPRHQNEMDTATDHIMLNDFMNCDVDVPMPLMEREYGIVESNHIGREYHYNLNTPEPELLIDKLDNININDPSISDSVNAKLRNLLLDSNRKKDKYVRQDNQGNAVIKDNIKATKTRKLSSTPRKRRTTHKTQIVNAQPFVEAEQTEAYAISRMSCPPVMQLTDYSLDIASNIDNAIEDGDIDVVNTKRRTKKDVIKVKIPRGKSKKGNKTGKVKNLLSTIETKSAQADNCSNETESGVFLQELNDSIDLIHNHSETCLHAHECVGEDSVEILEDPTRSIISLNTNSEHSYLSDHNSEASNQSNVNKVVNGFFCSNAQNKKLNGLDSPSTTVYHTPMVSLSSANSLMTEDLSSEVPDKTTHNSKWYLLSDEETTNTVYFDENHNPAKMNMGCGSSLNQIFPIVCAVPDLSTISEMSKENDESMRNTYCDANTQRNFDSLGLFNN